MGILSLARMDGPLWVLMALGNNCSGQTVVAWVDNLGAVFAYSKGYCCKCSFLNAIVHAAAVICQGLGARLVVKHMPRQGVRIPYNFLTTVFFLSGVPHLKPAQQTR